VRVTGTKSWARMGGRTPKTSESCGRLGTQPAQHASWVSKRDQQDMLMVMPEWMKRQRTSGRLDKTCRMTERSTVSRNRRHLTCLIVLKRVMFVQETKCTHNHARD
jgi:CBS-domain-containing membrane protein